MFLRLGVTGSYLTPASERESAVVPERHRETTAALWASPALYDPNVALGLTHPELNHINGDSKYILNYLTYHIIHRLIRCQFWYKDNLYRGINWQFPCP